MEGHGSPELTILVLGLMALGAIFIWRLACWIKQTPARPDPWDAEVERQLHEPDATPVCHHCFTPCPPRGWFCENCGCAVGPYNNLMPYLYAFSEGEVLRNGLNQKIRANFLTVVGYLLISFVYVVLLLPFLPFFWFRLVKNWKRTAEENEDTEVSAQNT